MEINLVLKLIQKDNDTKIIRNPSFLARTMLSENVCEMLSVTNRGLNGINNIGNKFGLKSNLKRKYYKKIIRKPSFLARTTLSENVCEMWSVANRGLNGINNIRNKFGLKINLKRKCYKK